VTADTMKVPDKCRFTDILNCPGAVAKREESGPVDNRDDRSRERKPFSPPPQQQPVTINPCPNRLQYYSRMMEEKGGGRGPTPLWLHPNSNICVEGQRVGMASTVE
jgi:hypothetical protein